MSTAEIKLKLIEEITKSNDEAFLIDALGLFREHSKGIYFFSPEETSMVNEGLEQYKRGEYLTEEEADKEAEQWLED